MFALRRNGLCYKVLVTRRSLSTKLSAIKKIGIVGAGQMGTGIAKVAITQAKLPVLLMDSNPQQTDRAVHLIDSLFAKDVAKDKITKADAVASRSRLSVVSSLTELADVDFVIEAAKESPELKDSIFHKLDEVVKKKKNCNPCF